LGFSADGDVDKFNRYRAIEVSAGKGREGWRERWREGRSTGRTSFFLEGCREGRSMGESQVAL